MHSFVWGQLTQKNTRRPHTPEMRSWENERDLLVVFFRALRHEDSTCFASRYRTRFCGIDLATPSTNICAGRSTICSSTLQLPNELPECLQRPAGRRRRQSARRRYTPRCVLVERLVWRQSLPRAAAWDRRQSALFSERLDHRGSARVAPRCGPDESSGLRRSSREFKNNRPRPR